MIDWSPDVMSKVRVNFFVEDSWGELEYEINTFIKDTPRIKKIIDVKFEQDCIAMIIYEVYND